MAINRLQSGSSGSRILTGLPQLPRAVPGAPLPEVAHRLRLAFPEVWRRYEELAADRGLAIRQQRAIETVRQRSRSSPAPPISNAAPTR